MGYRVKISSSDGLPDGLYPARFLEVKEGEGDNGAYLIWRFEALPDDGSPVAVSSISSTKFTPQAKGRQWLEALLSEPLEPGDEIDFATLRNRACQIDLRTATTAKGVTVNKIGRVMAPGLTGQKLKAKPEDADGEPTDDDDIPF
jgi:hypothetical protein